MENTVKDRIKKVVEVSGLSIAAFERELGWSNGYLNNCSSNLSLSKIKDVVDKFKVSRNWLIAGSGDMFDGMASSDKEDLLSKVSSTYDTSNREEIEEYKAAIKELNNRNAQLVNELVEQGKRMDVLLDLLRQRI